MGLNRFIIVVITALLAVGYSSAQVDEKNVTVSFNTDKFTLLHEESGNTFICSNDEDVCYSSKSTLPCLPYVSVNICIPSGYRYIRYEVSEGAKVVYPDVTLSTNPVVAPTSYEGIITQPDDICFEGQYPEALIKHISTDSYGEFSVAKFLVSPFEYDADRRILSFASSVNFTFVATAEAKAMKRSEDLASDFDYSMLEMIRRTIVNPQDLPEINPVQVQESEDSPLKLTAAQKSNFFLKNGYLIITNDALSYSFMRLLNWKHQKGIASTYLVTISDINSNYSGDNLQLKIKECIYDYYTNMGVKYVLLGGDDTIIPVMKCYAKVETTTEVKGECYDMPSDLFYACLDRSNFDWDANQNGIVAEVGDSIDFNQHVYVTRLPVNTTTDAYTAINRIINYEQGNLRVGNGLSSVSEMLLCGRYMFRFPYEPTEDRIISDSDMVSRLFEFNVLKKSSWFKRGNIIKHYFDTTNDANDMGQFSFRPKLLESEFNKPYMFVDISTHGDTTGFKTSLAEDFTTEMVQNINRNYSKVITTIACLTNAFDSNEKINGPCLSESFIRNLNSGIIAYLGCSREGWVNVDEIGARIYGPSHKYNVSFYSNLFANDVKTTNFGKIVAFAKSRHESSAKENNALRWIMLGLNPIGDPEMPVYTTSPQKFKNIEIVQRDGMLIVKPGVSGCNVCVMSHDFGRKYYSSKSECADSVFFGGLVPSTNLGVSAEEKKFTVTISKQDYIPKIITLDLELYMPTQVSDDTQVIKGITGCSPSPTSGNTTITYDLPNNATNARITICNIMGNDEISKEIDNTCSTIDIDCSGLKSGIHIATLYVDGQLINSTRIIKK